MEAQIKLGGNNLPIARVVPEWAQVDQALTTEGLELIKHFEGLRLKAYACSAGVNTIGYGHTSGVKPGMEITEKDANKYLANDVKYFADAVDDLIDRELTKQQKIALVSFCFNVGKGALRGSTLRKRLNKETETSTGEICNQELPRWCKANGKEVAGLKLRRLCEADLANGKDWKKRAGINR